MTRKTFISVLLASAALVFPAQPGLAQGGACWTDRQINDAIAAKQILSFPEIRKIANLPGKPLPFDVCEEGGRIVYKVQVVDGSGQAVIKVLNAVTGRP